MLRKFLLRTFLGAVKTVAAVLCVFAAMFCLYLGWSWWELRHLKQFCAEIPPGTPVSALPTIADKYSFSRRYVEKGIRDGDGWVTFVPAASTFGEIACEIRFNGKQVTSAKMDP